MAVKRALSSLAGLLIALGCQAGEKPESKSPPADKLQALKKEHEKAEAAFYKAVADLPNTPEGRRTYEERWKEYDKKQAERFLAAVELARAAPKSETGFAALEWVLTTPRAYYLPAGKPAFELAVEHHATNPKVGKIVALVGRIGPPEGDPAHKAMLALVKAVAEKNPDRTARGQAVMALAGQAKRKFARAEYQKSADVDALAATAEKAFEKVVKDYGDCPWLVREGAGTLGEVAKRELFELRHLRIGKVAPEITGEDLDGVKFKLSDYRGKVVVIDFWGDW
jgi:hypothetical protein